MKIKEIVEFKSLQNEKINLNLEEKILSIYFMDRDKKQVLLFKFLNYRKNLHLISENGQDITLIKMKSCNTDDNSLILYFKFENIFIGCNIDEDLINDVNKYIVKFKKVSMIKSNKCFEHNDYKCILGKDFVELTNIFSLKNSEEFLEEFLVIYELICLFIGYFPKIEKIELYNRDSIIKEYSELVYMYNSSIDTNHNRFSLVDINKISDFRKIVQNWEKIKIEVGNYPIWGIFVSQMEYNHYLDYILVVLLQSIDGYCEVKFKEQITNKSEKDKKIINYLTECINKNNEIKNSDKKKIVKYLEKYHSPCFQDYLEYLINNNKEYSDKIFSEEIYLNLLSQEELNCKLYVNKNTFLVKSINERRKISHMSKKDNVFENLQSLIAYYKWLLLYRIVIIKELGISIDEFMLQNCINKIRYINNENNQDKCNECKHYNDCKIKYKN